MTEELKDSKKTEVTLEEVVPTLFIALGGTGAEVLWRIRRRILNTLWGATDQPMRLESLSEFPFAEFLQIDLDASTVTESGKAFKTDILGDKIRFKEEEKLVKKLDLSKYVKSDDELAKFPMVQEWFPLPRAKLNELNLPVEKGAGQIRAISRLYFFDKYTEIKNAVRAKAEHLLASVQIDAAAKRLDLKMQTGALKIVVVASTAGGTGSGSFLDLGYLSGIIGKQADAGVTTNLVLMLPSGYKGANRTKTQANTYAALMELETCMRQGSRYIKGWNENEIIRDWPDAPYSDVYLIDTSNLAAAQTEDIKDVYDMLADALFEDFSTADFANKKRSISVNQNQHKTSPYSSRVNRDIYGDMQLTFSRGYSSFGQATIDTHLEQKRNIVLFRQVNGMLKAFFGVSAEDVKRNTPTEGDRDDLLVNRMDLGIDNDVIDYDFVARTESYRKGAERTTYPLVTELLRDRGISRLDDIEKRITDTFEEIRVGGNYKEWESKIAEAITQINRDTSGSAEGKGLHESAISKRRKELLTELLNPERKDGLIKALWARVDNKERGGLDYTIELIQRLKDRMENADTGLVRALNENANWYGDLSGHLWKEEIRILQEHLQQAIGKFIGAKDQSEAKIKQISNAVRLYVRYRLYGIASQEAASLVHELSEALGKQEGTDSDGNPIWGGFIGKLEAGRGMVRAIINDAEDQIARTNEAMKQGHAMYFVLPAPRSRIDELELLPPKQAREWAEEAFKDFGGTQELFAMLKDEGGRAELLGKLRNRALALVSSESSQNEVNPLFAALDAHPNRAQLFSDLLQRAMPWVAARLDGYLKPSDPADQYRCVIGVKNSKAFEARYGAELRSRVPTATMMTPREIYHAREIDAPGKLVCYVLLSGLPLPSLKALDDWYTSYREENARFPVHTHKRASMFVHPRELKSDELASRSEDLKIFIQAVALGVLKRSTNRADPSLYSVGVNEARRPVGDEKWLRLEGFQESSRKAIQQQVHHDLEELRTEDQLALWVALLEYFAASVYPLALRQENGQDLEQRSLPTFLCEGLVNEWTARLTSKTGGEMQAVRLLRSAREVLTKWTDEIPGSTADVYQYELNTKILQPKRVLKRDVLKPDWSLGGENKRDDGIAPLNAEAVFRAFINKKQEGPWTVAEIAQRVPSGVIGPDTKVWNMAWNAKTDKWQMAGSVPELQGLFFPDPTDGIPDPSEDEIPDPD